MFSSRSSLTDTRIPISLPAYNISQKVEIVVEHYRQLVAPLLDGKAKAMVVVGSRLEAVRWQVPINKYIRDHGYAIRTPLNPNLRGRDIREAFKTDEWIFYGRSVVCGR